MHRRALLLRAGVVGMLTAGALAIAAPAYADDKVSVTVAPNSFDLSPGQALDFVAEVNNKTDAPTSIVVTVTAPGNLGGDVLIATAPADCTGAGTTAVSCRITVDGGRSQQLGFKIGAKASPTSVQVGEQKQGQGSVRATMPGGNDNQPFTATLHGPAQAPTVPQVSGSVRDSTTGQPIKDVTVVLVDSGACGADKGCQTGTDAQGNFRFVAKPDKPITPGQIQIGATKTGYDNAQTTITARAGQAPPAVALKLKPAAEASASATAPAEAPSDTPGASGGANSTVNAKNTAGTGTSPLSWGLIGLGILLVLLGIGAIVFLLLRRKGAGPDDDDDPQGGRGPGPVPPSRGIYRTGEPVGHPVGADPTMVARSGLPGQPAMSGANAADTTAMLRPPRPPDEYGGGYPSSYGGPAPQYGAPPPPSGGTYGAPTAYGSPPPAYGTATYGGATPPDQGYGDDRQGYGARYAAGGAEHGGSPYGGSDFDAQPDYGGGYRDEPRHASGYGDDPNRHYDGGGYPPPAGGPYPQSGYDPPDGYERGGGYGRAAQHGSGGYDAGGSGYHDDEPPAGTPSRHAAPPPNRGGQRPPLDWLDD